MKLIIIVSIGLFFAGCFGATPKKTGLEGKKLPSFNLLLSDSSSYFNTEKIPIGKSFVIFYFSPSCPYCRSQMDDIISDIDDLKNIQIYMITNFPMSAMRKFEEDFKLSKYPNILIANDMNFSIGNYFKIVSVPYLAIYGKDKKLNKAFLGKVFTGEIKRIIGE